MQNEGERRKWGSIRRCTQAKRGGAPTRIKVAGTNGEPDQLYETQAEVKEQASRKLTARFKIDWDPPISKGQLFNDIGYPGDTASTKTILEGTYEFPPNMCPHTRLLCELAHEIFSQKSTEDISTFVQTSDYQYFWKRDDEFIQSSYSHIHFGHYKAAEGDRYLSALMLQNSRWQHEAGFHSNGGAVLLRFCWRRSLAISTLRRCGPSV